MIVQKGVNSFDKRYAYCISRYESTLIYCLRIRVHALHILCMYSNKGLCEVKEVCGTSDNNSFLFLLSLVTLGINFVSAWV